MHTNSGNPRRTLSGAARIAGLCTVLLSLACSDTQEQSGARPDAVHTSRQGVLQTDLTATETVTGITHSYLATLPPAAVVGTISQKMEANWSPSLLGLRQAPIYPEGWSIEYYAGSTQLPAEPTTASEWAQVSRVVTSGSFQVEALDGERQALISSVSSTIKAVASSFSGGSVGDGWDVFFDPAYTRVYNIHHHNNPATVMCRKLADASTCPGFPIALTQTSLFSTGRIDAASNKLWQPTVTVDGKLAWDCVDLTTPARCATPVVISQHASSGSDYNNHMDPVVIGRKMYALGSAAGGFTRVTCLDMATGAECAGMQLPESGLLYQGGIAAVGNKLYVLPGLNLHLDCYDSTTWQRCAGSWPKTVTTGPVWSVNSADGVTRNVCASGQCFGLDGSAPVLPTNFAAVLAANAPENHATSLGTRAAWRKGNAAFCWEMATDTTCGGRFPIGVDALYTTVLDPELPDCLWTNGDDGIIRNWNINTGNQGCTSGVPHITFKADTAIPRLSCDPSSRVFQYKSFKLTSPAPSQYTAAKLTVRDSRGVALSGWIDRPLSSADGTVDLTALSPTATGSTPTFDVAVEGLTDTSVQPSGTFRITTGAPPQLCWGLSEATPVCPSGPGLAGGSTSSQQTAVTVKGSFTTGSGTTSFNDRVLNSSVSSSPNFDNCGGTRLRATVVSVSDGRPVSGAVVFLRDSAGSPILDANGLPASAVSAANGTVEFPVWAAGYTLRLTGNTLYTPVSMTVDVGGSGTTQPSNGTVVSNTVTTTVNQTAHVTISVAALADPSAPCPPVITSPPGGTVVYTSPTPLEGTATAGSTVTVRANSQTVCTVVADDLGQWSCNAELPVGISTVTATAQDPDGHSSGTSSGVLITRRNGIDPPVITGPGASVYGPTVTVTGIGTPGGDITVQDEQGQTVCTAKADDFGVWRCDGDLSVGPHQLTANEEWQGLQGTSAPHDTTVLDEAWFEGSGCSSAGGASPALMVVLALVGLGVLRRRHEGRS